MARTYRSEFPEMGVMPEAQQLLALGFTDEAWHNDTAPRFVSPTKRVCVWIEHPNADQREEPGQARFLVQRGDFSDGVPADSFVAYEGDEWAKALEEAEVNLSRREDGTFTFAAGGVEIEYPLMSECSRFSASPDYYGFVIFQTGGGCTAWRRDFLFNGKPVYMLITAAADPIHEVENGQDCGMGVYDNSGPDSEAYINWTQHAYDLPDGDGGALPRTNIAIEGSF